MSRILLITQLVAIIFLWLVGFSSPEVACLSIVAVLVVAIGTVGLWIWQDQRMAVASGDNARTDLRHIRASAAAALKIAS